MKKIIALTLSILLLTSCSGIKGKVKGNVYENEFIGLGFNLPENWEFYSKSQLLELSEKSEDEGIIYDMRAYMPDNLNSAMINIEDVGKEFNEKNDVKTYLSKTISGVESSLGAIGYKNIKAEITEVKIGDKTFDALKLTAEMSSMTLNQLVFPIQKEEYIINVALTSFGENKTEEILKNFYIVS